ncbi:hypothetical protein PIB30_024503 [Stylosanthes scabra]|uniref:Uncharacterized protein n=1 Tax=Stylosanthes scabra TaxID=79078 RepID=A0ABU6ZA79_9FABA|nr:hypothetical protein [Stylosanthes scabra]
MFPSASSWWKTTENYKESWSNELYAITVVLTAKDVAVEGFCSMYGTLGSTRPVNGKPRTAYIRVAAAVDREKGVQC